MRGSVQPDGRLSFDVRGRWVAGPHLSLWAGLAEFSNQSYVLYGHEGKSHIRGPLEAH